jgi:hypothetical protein
LIISMSTPKKRKAEGEFPVGLKLVKTFSDGTTSANYDGTVVKASPGAKTGSTLCFIKYSDGDSETMTLKQVEQWRKKNLEPTTDSPVEVAAPRSAAKLPRSAAKGSARKAAASPARNKADDGKAAADKCTVAPAMFSCASCHAKLAGMLSALYLAANAWGSFPLPAMAAIKVQSTVPALARSRTRRPPTHNTHACRRPFEFEHGASAHRL